MVRKLYLAFVEKFFREKYFRFCLSFHFSFLCFLLMSPFLEVVGQWLIFGCKLPVLTGPLQLFFESQLMLNSIRWYISFCQLVFHDVFPVLFQNALYNYVECALGHFPSSSWFRNSSRSVFLVNFLLIDLFVVEDCLCCIIGMPGQRRKRIKKDFFIAFLPLNYRGLNFSDQSDHLINLISYCSLLP